MENQNIEYINLLNKRKEFFDSKKISDLNVDEVGEYLNLLQEWDEVIGSLAKGTENPLSEISEAFGLLAEQIIKNLRKMFANPKTLEAEELYRKRVIERKEHEHDHNI